MESIAFGTKLGQVAGQREQINGNGGRMREKAI
jgi:hypothetical protein